MSRASEAFIQGDLLHDPRGDAPTVVRLGSPAWFDWLREASRFTIETPAGRVGVRKEHAGNGRGGRYWRAYHKARGRLRRFYLGGDADLSAERIALAVETLLGPEGGAPAAGPNGSEHGPIARTRVAPPPPLAKLVARPALLAQLRAGAAGPLTLLVAPPGFGKTTLLAQLAASYAGAPPRRRGWAWLTLDRDDNHPASLVRALGAAIEPALPGVAPMAGAARPEAALTAMLNALAARGEGLTLILDDFQSLQAPEAHALIERLIEQAPPNLRLVIAGRADPPLPLARLRACGALSELRAAELRFTGAECAALLRQASGRELADADVAALEERTEGWAAGLHLAGLALRGASDPHRFTAAFAGTHRFVMDYLIEEVLRQQPPALRRFLLETSVLERLCAPLCDAVRGAGRGDSQDLLAEAERRGLFLTALDDERRWYRYHTLFAEVLRAELRREVGPERLAELRQAAARWQATQEGGDGGMVERLTPRELTVLELIAEGANNSEIAERLHIAVSTVKAHSNSIFGKLAARSRTQAVARARAYGLIR